MTVYVSLPQFPLTLKYEETIDEVADHLTALIEGSKVVLLNFAVVESISLNEGKRTLEVAELNRALTAQIEASPT